MCIPGPSVPCRVEQGMVLSLLPRLPQPQEESGPVRIDQEVQRKNLSRPPLMHKKGIPVCIGTDGPVKTPATQLPRPFSGPPLPEMHLLGMTGHSAGRLKLPEDGIQRPCQDPKALLARPCKSQSSIPMGGRLREFVKEWMGITIPSCWAQSKGIWYNSIRSPLGKAYHQV